MGELKTTETELNVNALLSNIPEGNIKKDSIIILELIKEVTNKSPKIWGDNSIIGFGNYSYFRKITRLNLNGSILVLLHEKIKSHFT